MHRDVLCVRDFDQLGEGIAAGKPGVDFDAELTAHDLARIERHAAIPGHHEDRIDPHLLAVPDRGFKPLARHKSVASDACQPDPPDRLGSQGGRRGRARQDERHRQRAVVETFSHGSTRRLWKIGLGYCQGPRVVEKPGATRDTAAGGFGRGDRQSALVANREPGEALRFERVWIKVPLADVLHLLECRAKPFEEERVATAGAGDPGPRRAFRQLLDRR